MNLPNKLTMSRFVLVLPTSAAMLLAPKYGIWMWICALVLFSAASITDAFDGAIARKRGIVTNFGKLMDPVADKLLVTAAFTCFVSMGICSPWILIIVLMREFLVTSVRMVASSEGIVIAANIWGKLKTISQMTAIITVMVAQAAELIFARLLPSLNIAPVADIVCTALLWLSAALTLISGAVYCWQSRALFKDAK